MTTPGVGRTGPTQASPRPAAAPFVVWGLLLGALAGLQAAFDGGLLAVLVQAGAGAVALTVGVAILLAGRQRPAGPLAVPELSLASALAGISAAAIVCGATVGSWLVVGGVLGLGLAGAGLTRERRAQQRATRLAGERLRAGR